MSAESHQHVLVVIPARHCKDPLPPWGSQLELIPRSHEIVDSFEILLPSTDFDIPLVARTI